MQILRFAPRDILHMKKKHPCGGDLFRILRVGSEVRIVCCACGRDMTLERIKLEKAIKQVVSQADPDASSNS